VLFRSDSLSKEAAKSGKGAPMFSNRGAHVSVTGVGVRFELKTLEYYEAQRPVLISLIISPLETLPASSL